MRWVIGVALCLGLVAPRSGVAASLRTSEVLLGCRAYAFEQNANFYSGICFGAVSTVLHMSYVQALRPSLRICAPGDATYGQAVRLVTQWVEDHPERQDESFDDLAVAALRSAWPCGR